MGGWRCSSGSRNQFWAVPVPFELELELAVEDKEEVVVESELEEVLVGVYIGEKEKSPAEETCANGEGELAPLPFPFPFPVLLLPVLCDERGGRRVGREFWRKNVLIGRTLAPILTPTKSVPCIPPWWECWLC